MSPLETIKSGILTNDMELVKEGYSKLTGEKLEQKQKKNKNAKPTKITKKLPPKIQESKKTIFGKVIEFVTDGTEAKDDPKLYAKLPQTKNRRDPVEKVLTRCKGKGCNDEKLLYPSQATSYYCESCVNSGNFASR